MALFLRVSLRLAAARRSVSALLTLSALGLGLLVASPAGALVTTVGETTVGLQNRSVRLFDGHDLTEAEAEHTTTPPEPTAFANTTGAPVLSSTRTYAIYWDPKDHYHGEWQEVIDTFFHNMAAESGSLATVFSVDSQYTDGANQHAADSSSFGGAYADTDEYPAAGCHDPHPLGSTISIKKGASPKEIEEDEAIIKEEEEEIRVYKLETATTCLTDTQVKAELETFIADHSLPKGMGSVFYLLTPPGVTVCLDDGGATGHCSDYAETESLKETERSYENSFCSYHSDINPTSAVAGDGSTIIYAVLPWTAGGLGDGQLTSRDQTSAVNCQDGGYNPASQPNIEEFEKPQERSPAEEEAFLKMNAKERAKVELTEELAGPHQEEPNQDGKSYDGYHDHGLADLIISQIGVEQQNMVTDPLLDGWQDPHGNEDTDECRDFFALTRGGSVAANEFTGAGTLFNQIFSGGDYYINDGFNLAALKLTYPGVPCLNGLDLLPHFTAPSAANTGEIVGFNGMESTITLDDGTKYVADEPVEDYATYKWNFGDGTPEVTGFAPGSPSANSPETSPCAAPWEAPCAASTFHAYQYGGTYDVTLTVTDTGGNTASTTEPIVVNGPPPPPPAGSGTNTAPGTQLGSGNPLSLGPPVPAPIATAAALSKSLRKVLKRGLVVRYSVNEQVAGRFEVLLATKTAQRLGIQGSAATGLPVGSEPALVIAHAILVTTKGGHSTVRIKFSKQIASHLKKLRKLSLSVRMTVRNAARQSPQTATVMSTVQLFR